MKILPARFTLAEYDALPEGFPAELIRGELVKEAVPTYGHQSVQMRLVNRLLPLVPEGRLLVSPFDVRIDDWNAFHPDIMVLRVVPDRQCRNAGVPLLVVEVLSESTRRRDLRTKRPRYLEKGVAEVWLVDEEGGTVERWDSTGSVIARGDERIASLVVPGFEVTPESLFRQSEP